MPNKRPGPTGPTKQQPVVEDLPILPPADLPESVQGLDDPAQKRVLAEVWKATVHLMASLDAWQDWFRRLRTNGDADPSVALFCQRTACQCVRVLCLNGINVHPFDQVLPETIFEMLPPIPDPEISDDGKQWHDEGRREEFLALYYGGPDGPCWTTRRLRARALQARLMLEQFPVTAISAKAAASGQQSEPELPALAPTAPPEPVIVSLGNGQYSPPGSTTVLTVTPAEDNVLQAFVVYPSMSMKDLIKHSGHEEAAKVLGRLNEKYSRAFAPAIRMAGTNNQGGYFVRIRRKAMNENPG